MSKQTIRPFRVLIGVVFGVTILGAWFAWHENPPMRVKSSSVPEILAEGVTHVTKKIVAEDEVTLNLILFREDRVRVIITANRSLDGVRPLAELAEQQMAIAGCNGGFFDPKTMQPSFLEIADGVSTGSFGERGQLGALFGVRSDVVFIENESEFQQMPRATAVVQCSPMLVDQGKPNFCSDDIPASRTFVMTDGSGNWAIGTVDRITLDDLAKLLTNKKIITELKVVRAMNLDGGPSAALWWRRKNGESEGVEERWPVRNVVLLVPK